MDSAIGFLLCLVFLALTGLGLAILYKNREAAKKWLNTPYHAEDDRELRLKRQIEDAQRELADLQSRRTE